MRSTRRRPSSLCACFLSVFPNHRPFQRTTVSRRPCSRDEPRSPQAQLAHIARRFQVDLLHGMGPPHPRAHDRPRLRPPARLLRPPAPPLAHPTRPTDPPSRAPGRTRRARVVSCMVQSGLEPTNLAADGAVPRVSQYRLAAHLGAALVLYAGMFAAAGAPRPTGASRGRALGAGLAMAARGRRCCTMRS